MPYFTHGETKYKLILLYIAEHAESLLTRDQLYRTAVLNSEMEFFAFEQAMHELEDDGMLTSVRKPFGECWGITDTGRDALSMFEKSIPLDERRKLDGYLEQNRGSFAREAEIADRIEKGDDGNISLELMITEHGKSIFSVRMSVFSMEQALMMRSRWEKNSEAIYNYVWDALTKKQDGAKHD